MSWKKEQFLFSRSCVIFLKGSAVNTVLPSGKESCFKDTSPENTFQGKNGQFGTYPDNYKVIGQIPAFPESR